MKRILGILSLLLLTACIKSPVKLAEQAASFWDGTKLSDPALTTQADVIDERFAEYLTLLEDARMPLTTSGALLQKVLAQTENNAEVFYMFWELCEKYLYAPDSPSRNEDLYGYALQTVITSNSIDDYNKIRPRYQLNMIARNRIGEPATDFSFTLPTSEQSMLYAVDAEYTIIYFHNPDCEACDEVSAELTDQRLIRRLEAAGRLRIIALYTCPEEDESLWRASLNKYPSNWIPAYDTGAQIHYQGLYDLRSIPCLYLLDAHKHVIYKGATSAKQIVQALKTTEARR